MHTREHLGGRRGQNIQKISPKYPKTIPKISKNIYIYLYFCRIYMDFPDVDPGRHWRARDATSTRQNARGKTLAQKNARQDRRQASSLRSTPSKRNSRCLWRPPEILMYRGSGSERRQIKKVGVTFRSDIKKRVMRKSWKSSKKVILNRHIKKVTKKHDKKKLGLPRG